MSSCYCFLVLPPERSRDPFLESPDNQRARKAVVVYVQDKDRPVSYTHLTLPTIYSV